MDIDQIIHSFEEKINIIKLKKIDVIFTKLNPDQNDIIQLNNLDGSLSQFLSEEAENLIKFFNTFVKQTGKNQMSRKYFYMNMMAAAQQNKFNINKMLYDEDINEIQKSLSNIKMKNRQQISLTQQSSQNSSVQQQVLPIQVQSTGQKQEKINLFNSNKTENQQSYQLQPNYPLQQSTILTSPPGSNSQNGSEFQNIGSNQDTNYVNQCNQIINTSMNSGYNNNAQAVQTTNISYIKNEDNQIIPHIEVSLKNAISIPMIPDQGVKDQYLNSQESSAQKNNYNVREQISISQIANNSFLGGGSGNGNYQNNSFYTNSCNISAIPNNSQGDSLFMSQDDQENQRYLLNKRQDLSLLKANTNQQKSNKKPQYLSNKNTKVSQSIDRQSNSQQNLQNDYFVLRENINTSNIQINNENKSMNQNNNLKVNKSLQESLYEQILKQKKTDQPKSQLPPTHPINQPVIITSSSIHQDKLIKIISRDKIIKNFKENFRGKENFCDDFMELDSTIRRLEKTNHSPVNSQINKTQLNECTTNYESQNLNKYSSINNSLSQINHSQFFSNNINNNSQNIQTNSTYNYQSDSNNNNNNHHNQHISSKLAQENKNYTPKVLKNVTNSNKNQLKKQVNQQLSNQKPKNYSKQMNSSHISKSSSKENGQQREESLVRNSDSGMRRVTRSVSSNIISKQINPSRSPSQGQTNKKAQISRKISSDQIPSYLKEQERSISLNKRESKFQEKTPLKFIEFKQKQQQFNNQKAAKKDIKKENSLEKLAHPKVYSSTPANKCNNQLKDITQQGLHQINKELNKNNQIQVSPLSKNRAITPKPKDSSSNRQYSSISSIDRTKKVTGYQEQFNKKKQQHQQQRSSRDQCQGQSSEGSIYGLKKGGDQEESQQEAEIIHIPKYLQKEDIDLSQIELEINKTEQQIQENKIQEIANNPIQSSHSPNYQQYYEKIIMQDERISKYFTTQNEDEGSQFFHQQSQHNQSLNEFNKQKSSHLSSRITDHSTLREQNFEVLEGKTLEQQGAFEKGERRSSSRNYQNKHETIYQLMMNENMYHSPLNQQQVQENSKNDYEQNLQQQEQSLKQSQQDQYPPQFGGYCNQNSNQSMKSSQQNPSYLDSPSQFLEVLKTKMDEDENNEFLLMQMENLKKIQQEKQKLMQEEAEMLQQLQKSQVAKSSQRNSLQSSIQSILANQKQLQQPQQQSISHLRQSQERVLPGLPLPQRTNSLQQQNLSVQQQQLRSSYYQNGNNNKVQNNNQSQNNQIVQEYGNNLNKSSINTFDNQEQHNFKEFQSAQNQNSNYNSSSSQRDAQGSIDSGYNYTTNAANKYSSNQSSQHQQSIQNQPQQIEQQNFFPKQIISSSHNLISQPISSNHNNHNSSLNFSFTDS